MSQPSPLKEEIKKSVVTEPIKILIGLLVTPVLTLILARIPQVRAHLWPLVPKWLLLVLSVVFLSAILALVPYVWHLRRKSRDANIAADDEIKTLTNELETLKAKPNYPFKFGVKWDDDLNAHCPHCDAYLTGFQYIILSANNAISRVQCSGCGRLIFLSDERGLPIRFADARQRVDEG
jgi:hypothetical protein